jgi:hypothetical protein
MEFWYDISEGRRAFSPVQGAGMEFQGMKKQSTQSVSFPILADFEDRAISLSAAHANQTVSTQSRCESSNILADFEDHVKPLVGPDSDSTFQ